MRSSSRTIVTLSQHLKKKLEEKAEKNGYSTNNSKTIILNLSFQFVRWDVFYRDLRVITPKFTRVRHY